MGAIAMASAFSALLGYSVFSNFSPQIIAATTAIAAGAILVMLADTMIPEAFEKVHELSGLIMVMGFMTAYLLSKMEGGVRTHSMLEKIHVLLVSITQ